MLMPAPDDVTFDKVDEEEEGDSVEEDKKASKGGGKVEGSGIFFLLIHIIK